MTEHHLRLPAAILGAVLLPLLLSPKELEANDRSKASPTRELFELKHVFDLEFASDPQVSPDGQTIIYVRNFFDIMTDRKRSNLWSIGFDGSNHRPLTSGNEGYTSPRWSPDGQRLLYLSGQDGSSQLYLRWMDTGQTAKLTNLTSSPSGLMWSPDGRFVAFSMLVKNETKPFAKLPTKPEGAEWAAPARVIESLTYRRDGAGYLTPGFRHLFVLPADGGTPRQLTRGDFHHAAAPVWSHDGKSLFFSANRNANWEREPRATNIYSVSTGDLSIHQWTERKGPESSPALSPDGRSLAYVGFEDRYQGYQVSTLSILDLATGVSTALTGDLDRDIQSPIWSTDGKGIYFAYSDQGNTKIAHVALTGKTITLASDLGGASLGRPYGGGSFTVARNGAIAYMMTRPEHPADLAVVAPGGTRQRLTHLNDDLLGHKQLATVEEIRFTSSYDDRSIQGWLVKPPGFDPTKKTPLILEIHGGPFADYGDRFAAEIQLFAAAGYLVLYTNPRGSTSYGGEFGNLIHHNYPGEDYDDLMSAVDAVIARGFVDEGNLFVTGGSGGGVLTSWIVGKTNRFRAAVVAKPVINWISFCLTADMYNLFHKYWFPGFPWDHPEHYFKRSPLSLVGNVTTPTMLLTGEADYRTPIAESEQYYQALKLRQIDTAMVRIPGASHGITARPSHLISKVAHILEWFERYRKIARG